MAHHLLGSYIQAPEVRGTLHELPACGYLCNRRAHNINLKDKSWENWKQEQEEESQGMK